MGTRTQPRGKSHSATAMRRLALTLLVAVLSFQGGRLVESAVAPCKLRPLAALVAPLLGKQMPSQQVCDLILKLPSP